MCIRDRLTTIAFGSDAYFALLDNPDLAQWLALSPELIVVTEAGELIRGEAHTDKGPTVPSLRLPLTSFHSKRDLIRQLPSADLQWTGSDNNVQGLLRVLARRPVPRRPGSNMLLFNALAYTIVDEDLVDASFMRERVLEFDEFKEFVKEYSPEAVAERCVLNPERTPKGAGAGGAFRSGLCLGVAIERFPPQPCRPNWLWPGRTRKTGPGTPPPPHRPPARMAAPRRPSRAHLE